MPPRSRLPTSRRRLGEQPPQLAGDCRKAGPRRWVRRPAGLHEGAVRGEARPRGGAWAWQALSWGDGRAVAMEQAAHNLRWCGRRGGVEQQARRGTVVAWVNWGAGVPPLRLLAPTLAAPPARRRSARSPPSATRLLLLSIEGPRSRPRSRHVLALTSQKSTPLHGTAQHSISHSTTPKLYASDAAEARAPVMSSGAAGQVGGVGGWTGAIPPHLGPPILRHHSFIPSTCPPKKRMLTQPPRVHGRRRALARRKPFFDYLAQVEIGKLAAPPLVHQQVGALAGRGRE